MPDLAVGTFPFADIEVHYQMIESEQPATSVVLLLHGMKFTSDIWVKLGTLKRIWKAGFTPIAIDLPGYGKTRRLPYVDNNMRAELVKSALEFARKGTNTTSILITPSMSGKWAVPFLDRYGLMLAGWAAIAPVGISQWGGPWEYTHRQVHLWAMYGERDPMKQDADQLTNLFQNARKVILKDAGHACYLDQPDAFHKSLLEFMQQCQPSQKARDFMEEDGL